MIKNLSIIFIISATGLLTAAYTLAEQQLYIPLIIAIGGLWLLCEWRHWNWFRPVGLILLIGLAAAGIGFNITPIWLLWGTITALIAWDLARFAHRLTLATPLDDTLALQQAHLRRLSLVGVIVLALGSLGLGFEINLNFGWVVFLALLMTITLSLAVAFTRRLNKW